MVGKRVKSHVVEKLIFSLMLILTVAALFIFVNALQGMKSTEKFMEGFEDQDKILKGVKSDIGEISRIPSCQTDYMTREFDRVYDALQLKEDMKAVYTMQISTINEVNMTKVTIIELMLLVLIAILAKTVILVRIYEKVE